MTKMNLLTTVLLLSLSVTLFAQSNKTPAVIYYKDGGSIDIQHFGQLKCGKSMYQSNSIIIRGKYLDSVTEIKEYGSVEKIILEGFTKDPSTSTGNEKAVIRVIKKNGISVSLEDADIALSCYGPEDKFNQLVVQIFNPITEKVVEKVIATKDIQSVVFK